MSSPWIRSDRSRSVNGANKFCHIAKLGHYYRGRGCPSNEENFTANAPNGNSKILPPAALLASRIASTMRNQKEEESRTENYRTVIGLRHAQKMGKLGGDLYSPEMPLSNTKSEVFPPWEHVSQCLKVSRIFRQDESRSETRIRAVSLYGNNDGWVEHKELGVTYGFDCSKVMFFRNCTEKKRKFDICRQ